MFSPTSMTCSYTDVCPWPLASDFRDNLPELFCWTKMGVEAGQSLSAIIRRKELERQLGNGFFVWGIGNSLGTSLHQYGHSNGSVPLLFSPIQSKPRQVDVNPGRLILWLSYLDETGKAHALPEHTFVTSRALDNGVAGQKKHYALFCFSDLSLQAELGLELNFNELRNAHSFKPLGFSQVTAFVRRTSSCNRPEKSKRIYDVPIHASLLWPFCARLVNGVELPGKTAFEIEAAAQTVDVNSWADFVVDIRNRAKRAYSDVF